MEHIFTLDKPLFKLVNYYWHNNFFDWLMPWLRNALVWAPLYLFITVFIAINFKKKGLVWLLFFIACVVITNFISSNLIKENIWRLRPCNDSNIADWVRVLVGYRPQSSSFTSSHAANHFGLAMFIYITLKKYFNPFVVLFFIWAFGISYAQVYVGVHYPIDVTCGALIGILVGYLLAKMFNKKVGLI